MIVELTMIGCFIQTNDFSTGHLCKMADITNQGISCKHQNRFFFCILLWSYVHSLKWYFWLGKFSTNLLICSMPTCQFYISTNHNIALLICKSEMAWLDSWLLFNNDCLVGDAPPSSCWFGFYIIFFALLSSSLLVLFV